MTQYLTDLKKSLGQGSCIGLLVSLVLLLLLLPLSEHGRWGPLILAVLVSMTFIGGVQSVGKSPRQLYVGYGLLAVALVMLWLRTTGLGTHSLAGEPSWYSFVFYLYLGELLRRTIFKSGPITRSRLMAALCFYLLMGLWWAQLYVVVLRIDPGAISNVHSGATTAEMIYFSFVTLTTLGYGDSVPVSMFARSLAILEALTGVLFMGTLIARFAGAMKEDAQES